MPKPVSDQRSGSSDDVPKTLSEEALALLSELEGGGGRRRSGSKVRGMAGVTGWKRVNKPIQ